MRRGKAVNEVNEQCADTSCIYNENGKCFAGHSEHCGQEKIEPLPVESQSHGSAESFDFDKAYLDWSGDHHTANSNRNVHDSAEAMDFAEYCVKGFIQQNDLNQGRETEIGEKL